MIDVNLAQHEITIEQDTQTETIAYDLLVGADGIRLIVRTAMMQSANPIQVQQQQRPQVWKVLQLPILPTLKQTPQIIRLETLVGRAMSELCSDLSELRRANRLNQVRIL